MPQRNGWTFVFKMVAEPHGSVMGYLVQGAVFFEKVCGTGNDLHGFLTAQCFKCLFVQLQNSVVAATDNQKGGASDLTQYVSCQIRPAAT